MISRSHHFGHHNARYDESLHYLTMVKEDQAAELTAVSRNGAHWRAHKRYLLITLIVGLCVGSPGCVPSVSAATTGQIAAINFAKQAVSRALDYDQGNSRSLMDARDDFTPEGWREFMKWLDGYVDAKGAPTGSSIFTATGDAVVKSQEHGILRLAIPGILKQQSKNAYGGLSTTTYRVVVDVELGGVHSESGI